MRISRSISLKDLIKRLLLPNFVIMAALSFLNMAHAQSVQIGESLKDVGKDAFKFCTELKSVYIRNLNHWLAINFANEAANPLWDSNVSLFLNGEPVNTLTIPGDVTIVPFASFAHCSSIESVTFERE